MLSHMVDEYTVPVPLVVHDIIRTVFSAHYLLKYGWEYTAEA